jgi:Flp pilus assembly protein TadG
MHLRRRSARHGAIGPRSRGQSLAEFAIVFPVLMLIIGAIIQFGIIFWGQNTLTQIARDTGRWAATEAACDTPAERAAVLATAKSIAGASKLIGPSGGWTSPANVDVGWSATAGLPLTPPPTPCPPASNQQLAFVTITITHQVPIFFPWVPGNGNLTTQAQFRMEPHP